MCWWPMIHMTWEIKTHQFTFSLTGFHHYIKQMDKDKIDNSSNFTHHTQHKYITLHAQD